MTSRLYYDDCYLKEFSARVISQTACDRGYMVTLDQTAFYPTSGGQPYDTGTLGEASVVDVFVDSEGEVRHVVDSPLNVGDTVTGRIDWARRFDHMQQHAGEHMIAGAIWKLLGGHTIGLHLGADFSTIDVDFPDGSMRVSQNELDDIENTVNGWIQQDLPIKCWFPSDDEIKTAPLRKPPTVAEHIRLVQIGDVECVACGGTHPNSTGQIGLVKILDARPSRGKMRVSFVCGMRAVLDYRTRFDAACHAAEKLSTSVDALPDAVDRTLVKLHEAEREISILKSQAAARLLETLIKDAKTLENGVKAVAGILSGCERKALMDSCKTVTDLGLYALLANGESDDAALIFAAPDKSATDMGAVLSQAVKPLGGKGGGRGNMAQGAGPGRASIEAGLRILGSIKNV